MNDVLDKHTGLHELPPFPCRSYLTIVESSQVLEQKHANFSLTISYEKAVGVLSEEDRCEFDCWVGKARQHRLQAAVKARINRSHCVD